MTSQKTRVVHVRDAVPGAVYIGRPAPRRALPGSPFGNPHRITASQSRGRTIQRFGDDLTRGKLRHLLARLPELRGKPLACWCRRDGEAWSLDTACHGDVLVALLERFSDEDLRAMAGDNSPQMG